MARCISPALLLGYLMLASSPAFSEESPAADAVSKPAVRVSVEELLPPGAKRRYPNVYTSAESQSLGVLRCIRNKSNVLRKRAQQGESSLAHERER